MDRFYSSLVSSCLNLHMTVSRADTVWSYEPAFNPSTFLLWALFQSWLYVVLFYYYGIVLQYGAKSVKRKTIAYNKFE